MNTPNIFQQKTAFISGASRGIGKAIALRLAREGAQIIVAAKSVREDSRLGGTIFSAAEEIEAAGGKAFPIACDIREEAQIQEAVAQGAAHFGGIDIVVHNASAISLSPTESTEAKRLDLMLDINVRGTFLVTKYCLPWLRRSAHPHILTLAPPIHLDPRWLGPHVAYTLSKYGMSMLTLGWAAELREAGIAANCLWPATTIATAAVQNLLGGEALVRHSRKPEVVADAAYYILRRNAGACSGNCFIDEEVFREEGIHNLEAYSVVPGAALQTDLFLPENSPGSDLKKEG